jgi:benzoate-CoA ligase family protein
MNKNATQYFIRKAPTIAIYYEDEKITYDSLYDNVNRYANLLSSKYNKGDEILVIMNDRPEYFYLFWGAVKVGIIPSLLSTMLTDDEYQKIKSEKKYKHVFTDENIAEFDAAATSTDECDMAHAEDTDLCFYLFSSGTTGYITAIPHKHRDMARTAINYAKKTLNMTAYDVCYSSAKLFFAYGFGNSMTFPLFVGASTVLVSESSTAKTALETIEKYKPSLYFGVPTLYAHMLKSLSTSSRDLSSVRLCISAGEPLSAKIFNDWNKTTGAKILDGIGTTEALHIFISNRVEDNEAGCSGRLVPGYQARILDVQGNEVPDGEVGYLYIKGESISGDNEWNSTGDMFIKNGPKYYYQGRANDMLKIGGLWVSPTKIESKIMEHSNVLEVGVVQSSDANGLIKPKAYVVTKSPCDDPIKFRNELKKLCIDELPPNHYPNWIELVSSLPKTATGKIKRFQLRVADAFSPPNEEVSEG